MNAFDEFSNWRAETADEIKKWPGRLEQEAFKQMREHNLTIGQTKRLIRDQKPPIPKEYHATAPELFRSGLVDQIVEETYQKVNRKINDSKLVGSEKK